MGFQISSSKPCNFKCFLAYIQKHKMPLVFTMCALKEHSTK